MIAIPPPPASLATDSPTEVAHFAATLSRAIYAHTEATQHKIGDRFHGATPLNEMLELAKEIGIYDWEMVHEQRYLVLQTLFQAVAVVLWGGGLTRFRPCHHQSRKCVFYSSLRGSRRV